MYMYILLPKQKWQMTGTGKNPTGKILEAVTASNIIWAPELDCGALRDLVPFV